MEIRKFVIHQLMVIILCAPTLAVADKPQILGWMQLVPEGWNPSSPIDRYSDEEFSNLSDEQYLIVEKEVQAMLDAAPTVDKFNGKDIKIPGYLLPLNYNETHFKEFLLVPYFDVCVHAAPPPANQAIRGKLKSSFAMNKIGDPVWLLGKLQTMRSKSQIGEPGFTECSGVESAYTIDVLKVEPFLE